MKIAIHKEGSWNEKVAAYCVENKIEHQLIDFKSSNIIEKLNGFTHAFWLYHHANPNDVVFAPKILSAIDRLNIKVFPNNETRFHFDDKVAQKYLFEALNIETPQAWVFYDEASACEWSKADVILPIVAKLKGGAGSYNVKLIRSNRELNSYIKKCFNGGIKNYPSITKDLIHKTKQTHKANGFKSVLKRAMRIPGFLKAYNERKKYSPVDIGYVYFQEFVPGNKSDIRVSVVGDKAWAYTRFVRENDFRASGSGSMCFDHKKIPDSLIEKSFSSAKSLKMQSCCFDWVKDTRDNSFKVVEVSMGFVDDYVIKCGGYFDNRGRWHDSPTSACEEVFKQIIETDRIC